MRPLVLRRRHAVVALVAAASVGFGLVPGLTAGRAAAAPSPAPKPGSIAALKADVQRTSDRLAAAVTAYEKGQVQLGALLSQRVRSERQVGSLQDQALQARQRVSTLANHLYRNPVNPLLIAVLGGNATSINDVLYVNQALARTNAAERRDVQLLGSRAQVTQQLFRQQDDAAAGAIALQRRLDDALTRLQADALASQKRLADALAELRRRQAEAAARAFGAAGSGGGATCSGPVPVDAVNGFLPDSALCWLKAAPGHRLIGPAAATFDAMAAAFTAATGSPLCVTDSYRDYATQVSVFARKPNLAATPGRSQHGWGRAVDLCGGVQRFGTPQFDWLKQHAGEYGWEHPDWAEPDGSKPEPWHWEFHGDGR